MNSRLSAIRFSLMVLAIVLLSSQVFSQQSKEKKKQEATERRRQEEIENYYQKWLNEDVIHIITDEERSIFAGLTTPEEREQFVEQFWHRRDPDWSTANNEFKEEHYRRIAYANEHFGSGQPGWKTDRGRIYIIHGPPAEIEAHPAGGAYQRPMHEGGGTTATFPFEIWRYRHIEGLGGDIELEFVDPTFSEEFRLSRDPWEKDALLYIPGAGMTLAEEMGLASKAQRPALNPGSRSARENYPLMAEFWRTKNDPFRRYETYTFAQRPLELKYRDLKEIVDVNISYDNLPFRVRSDYFTLSDDRVLVPITVEFDNKDLTFQEESGVYAAKIGIYGIITTITSRLITEFEDDVFSTYRPELLQLGLQFRSMYQKALPLDRNMKYKLDLVVKDLNSGNVGVIRQAIVPPPESKSQELSASSLILSDSIRPLQEIPTGEQMFVLGDVQVLPFVRKAFFQNKPLGVYLQVYGISLDQTSLEPSLRMTFRLMKDGEVIAELIDEGQESIQFFSAQRMVLIRQLSLQSFEPGSYKIEVLVEDRISQQSIQVRDDFRILPPLQLARISHTGS